MKNTFYVMILIGLLSTCSPEEEVSYEKKVPSSLASGKSEEIKNLDELIIALQESSEAKTSQSTTFFYHSPFGKLKAHTRQDMNPLLESFQSLTLTLAKQPTSKNKIDRCTDYEADIWWTVFWFMQQEPKINMQEADHYAKQISTWAYKECKCANSID